MEKKDSYDEDKAKFQEVLNEPDLLDSKLTVSDHASVWDVIKAISDLIEKQKKGEFKTLGPEDL